ncbi:MAG: hypothetical protein ACE3L7_25600 [Candidatus Pristimantibacillus sp.]
MKFAENEVRLTDHAHEQYRDRVEPIDRRELEKLLADQVHSGEYYRKNEFLQMDGVWWVVEYRQNEIVFITTYGRSHIYIPAAKKWARQHHDRIDLTGGEGLCNGETNGQTKKVRR